MQLKANTVVNALRNFWSWQALDKLPELKLKLIFYCEIAASIVENGNSRRMSN